ncbi:hypothetical protein LS68_008225 [Helicobacter sp. MIT 05-5293]|uniref:hypothetical protein n=1 Tax=Helicobacter sp. MIT 05-5293 TaxID=1548149 RepID=UPI0010FD64C0|nr:hypothetical protein [Helicobacter sp. MIT 05-5293]TLD80194.1 hypothetical protein LS68_008225 [Helicobacter sp. MIT 05-5293]
MLHIVFNADENYIKYTAVLMTNIIAYTDTSRDFSSFSTDSIFQANKVDTTTPPPHYTFR